MWYPGPEISLSKVWERNWKCIRAPATWMSGPYAAKPLLKAGAGNIEVFITEQPDGDSDFSTGAGNVMVYLAGSVGVDVDAECAVGSARTDYPLKVEGKWTRKSFSGSVNGGGPDLRLYAAVGNVTLRKK